MKTQKKLVIPVPKVRNPTIVPLMQMQAKNGGKMQKTHKQLRRAYNSTKNQADDSYLPVTSA